MYEIYTDGAASDNGSEFNTGGFGVAVFKDEQFIDYYYKKSVNTTNNIEELKAILYATLQYGKGLTEPPIVYSDSAYAVNTLTNWMYGWEKAGWKKADKKEPKNLNLIKAYYDLVEKQNFKIILKKVKGHSNILGNELADQLAHSDHKKADELLKNNNLTIIK